MTVPPPLLLSCSNIYTRGSQHSLYVPLDGKRSREDRQSLEVWAAPEISFISPPPGPVLLTSTSLGIRTSHILRPPTGNTPSFNITDADFVQKVSLVHYTPPKTPCSS